MEAIDREDRWDEAVEQESLSQRLRDAREYVGLSQEFVAQQLGVPRASVSAMETGKRKVSSLELKRMAHLYRRPVEYFLGEIGTAGGSGPDDPTSRALFRTARDLSEEDRQQVLRFAQFLRGAGKAPAPREQSPEPENS